MFMFMFTCVIILLIIIVVFQWLFILLTVLIDNQYKSRNEFYLSFIPMYPLARAIRKELTEMDRREMVTHRNKNITLTKNNDRSYVNTED